MSLNSPDLFSSLFRWAHSQHENFATDAFVFVVNQLLHRAPDVACEFLHWLCLDNQGENPFLHCLPQLSTQFHADTGIPDIVLRAPNVFILIEVKKDSDLHTGQLNQYHTLLRDDPRRTEQTKRLVLLTVHQATFEEHEKPDLHRRWGEVESWWSRKTITDPVAAFLIHQFCAFLRKQVMALEKVEWPLVDGARSLLHLMNMLNVVLDAAVKTTITKYTPSRTWYAPGFYVDEKNYWVGVNLERPEFMQFEFSSAQPDKERFLAETDGRLIDGKYAFRLDLASEQVHFFACSKETQYTLLKDFVLDSYLKAEARRAGIATN